jgi:cytochrome P450
MTRWFSDVAAFRRDPLKFLLDCASVTPEGLHPLALGIRPAFLVTDPDLVKPLLKLDDAKADKGRIMQTLRPILGNSTLLINGSEYRRRREVLHANLARGNAEKFVPDIGAEIRRAAALVARDARFNPRRITAPLALRIVCITVFGRQVLSPGDEQALVAAVNAIEDDVADGIFRALPLPPWQWLARRRRRAFAKLAMTQVVDKLRKDASETSALKALEALDLSDDDLRHEILTLLLAGHHTTGSAAAWLLYHLAAEPGLMDEIIDEADSVTDANGEITAEGLKRAPASQALVREVLRLYPSTWWFSREVRQPLELGPHRLKPGATLIVSPWQMHRNPLHWDEPARFRLDRNFAGRAYLPFGSGPRACVGMGLAMLELQLLALEIAAAYRFGDFSPRPAPWPKPSVTLIPPDMSIAILPREGMHTESAAA